MEYYKPLNSNVIRHSLFLDGMFIFIQKRIMDKKDIKLELTRLISDIENPELIDKIRAVLKDEDGHFWDSLSDEEKEHFKQKNAKDG